METRLFLPSSHSPFSCICLPLVNFRWKSVGKGVCVVYGVNSPNTQNRETEGQKMDLRVSKRMTRSCSIECLISTWKSNITEMQMPYLVTKKKKVVREHMGTWCLLNVSRECI